jgi:hypothetical protein
MIQEPITPMNAAVAVNPASVVAQSAVVMLSPRVVGIGASMPTKIHRVMLNYLRS